MSDVTEKKWDSKGNDKGWAWQEVPFLTHGRTEPRTSCHHLAWK